MKRIGLISPNFSEGTLVDVYKILPEGIHIEGRNLDVARYIDSEFQRVEQTFADVAREQNALYPWLDLITSVEERANLLAGCSSLSAYKVALDAGQSAK